MQSVPITTKVANSTPVDGEVYSIQHYVIKFVFFTNYDIIAYFLNLASCSEHFISIKHRILATFNINKKNQYKLLEQIKSHVVEMLH
jgi:hypothetical protein